MSLRLFVLRHGETVFTAWLRLAHLKRRTPGFIHCDNFAVQVKRERLKLGDGVRNGRKTTCVIRPASRQQPHRVAVQIMPAFRELGFGAWEGRTRAEVEAAEPALYDVWRTAPDRFAAPGGESLPTVAKRVAEGIETLRADHDGESVVLVTHAVVIRLIVLDGLGLGPARLWSIDASPAGITELEYRDDWVTVHRMNTLAHLGAEAER